MQHWTYVQGMANLSTTIFHPQPLSDFAMLIITADDPAYRASSVKALF